MSFQVDFQIFQSEGYSQICFLSLFLMTFSFFCRISVLFFCFPRCQKNQKPEGNKENILLEANCVSTSSHFFDDYSLKPVSLTSWNSVSNV